MRKFNSLTATFILVGISFTIISLFFSIVAASQQTSQSNFSSSPFDVPNIWWSPVIKTASGPIQGYTAFNVNHFLGVPFAAPPVNDLRFVSPQPVEQWTKVRSSIEHGNICPQQLTDSISLGDEDCLYLNVYQPADVRPDESLPVLVWIYGGAFVFGDGYEFGLYSATNLVSSHRYIAVTFNYRLGALGFMALNSLKSTDPWSTTGNYGIADQIAVLKWVQTNIGYFNGNASRVTIAGESAGAMSVCLHLASPLSRGLFHGAIMESGVCDSSAFFVDYDSSVGWSLEFAQSLGCNFNDSQQIINCLRKLPAETLLSQGKVNTSQTEEAKNFLAKSPTFQVSAMSPLQKLKSSLASPGVGMSTLSVTPPPLPLLYPTIPWAPTIDNVVLTSTPLASITAGDWANVPVIVGTNRDEGSIFIRQLYQILPNKLHDPLTEEDLPVILSHLFDNSSIVSSVLAAYPVQDYASINNLTEIALRDFFFACPSRRLVRAINGDSVNNNIWLYQFDYLSDFIEDKYLGVYHSSELEFVFNNAWPPLIHSFSKKDQYVADIFGAYWTNLIYTGSVNEGPEKIPLTWPVWNNSSTLNLKIDEKLSVNQNYLEEICQLWDQIAEKTNKPGTGNKTNSANGEQNNNNKNKNNEESVSDGDRVNVAAY